MIQLAQPDPAENNPVAQSRSNSAKAENSTNPKCSQDNGTRPTTQPDAPLLKMNVPKLEASAKTVRAEKFQSRDESASRPFRHFQEWSAKRRNAATRLKNYCADRWAFEILSSLFALLCLVAIIVILVVYQDKSLPQWPEMISINSLIAVFTALMKAALMVPITEGLSQLKWLWFEDAQCLIALDEFDSASRGPLGAVSLMFQRQKHYLATLGAFLAVAAFAIDPFSQQILLYYTCMQNLPEHIARIPRTNNYTSGALYTSPGHAVLEGPMAGAMYLSVLDAPSRPSANIQTDCPTGNCTFPSNEGATFSTIGMCSSAHEVTHEIQYNEKADVYWLPGWRPDSSARIGQLKSLEDEDPYSELSAIKTLARNESFDDLFTIDILMFKTGVKCNRTVDRVECEKQPWAARLSLYPCLRTYGASITNTELNERLVSTSSLRKSNASAEEAGKTKNLSWSIVTDTILRNGHWETCIPSKTFNDDNQVAVTINNTLQTPGIIDEPYLWYPKDCSWYLDSLPALAINQLASWMFDNSSLWSPDGSTVTNGALWLKAFYRNGTANLDTATQFMAQFADGITSVIRQHGQSSPQDYALGAVLAAQTCISVRWVWLSLPASILALTIVFLGATMHRCVSSRTWQGSWRSSILAPLFHGLEPDTSEKLRHVVVRSEMEEAAMKLRMQLVALDGKYRFVEKEVE